jgi:hypothetical protein
MAKVMIKFVLTTLWNTKTQKDKHMGFANVMFCIGSSEIIA